jgi:hypothetical protein
MRVTDLIRSYLTDPAAGYASNRPLTRQHTDQI